MPFKLSLTVCVYKYMIYLITRKTWQCVSTNDVLLVIKVRNGLITSLSVF